MHKTDVGGVRLGVPDEAELRRVFAELAVLCPGRPAVLVQPMTRAGTEVILGAVQDEQFGPTVMIGSGGILADVIADRAFRLAPLRAQDAEDMLADLRTAVLFDGYRGASRVSRAALADLAVRIGALADDLPEVAELDLNPVICHGENLLVVDARSGSRQRHSDRIRCCATCPDRVPPTPTAGRADHRAGCRGASDVFLPHRYRRDPSARIAPRPGVGRTGNRRLASCLPPLGQNGWWPSWLSTALLTGAWMRRSTHFGADVDAGDRTGYFAQFDAFGIARSFATLSTGVAFAIAKWLAAKEGLCWDFTPS